MAGGGKSYITLLKCLKFVNDPEARVVVLRKSYPQIKISGGLLDESRSIFTAFNAVLKVQALKWVFPNGATIQFMAMPDELSSLQGAQFSHILCDELAEFSQEDTLFLMSRLRSAKYRGHLSIMGTCNPSRTSFLYDWVAFSLDPETGIPLAGTEDITRYFCNVGGKIEWGYSKKELTEKFGKGVVPLSFRFVPLVVTDNPVLISRNPGYVANLENMGRVSRARFLLGSWTAIPEGTGSFNREWVEIVDYTPVNPVAVVRSWDLAASIPSESAPDPDYTAGVKMSRDKIGTYYIEHVERFRKLTDGVLKTIIDVADRDGKADCQVTIPRDAGSGGKTANAFYIRTLAEHFVPAKSVVVSGHSGKVQRFLPFCSLAESGAVKIVRGDWNNEYLTELEFFTGSRNQHDDQVDATSDAFNTLARQIQLPTFAVPSMEQASPIPRV